MTSNPSSAPPVGNADCATSPNLRLRAAQHWFARFGLLLLAGALLIADVSAGSPQTIQFDRLVDQFVGAAPSNLVARATSGLPVSFTSTTAGTCTASGTQLVAIAVGACTVRAAQAGNTAYDPAAYVDQTINLTTVTGGPMFRPPVNYATGLYPDGMAAADFNRDGKQDLAVVNWSEGSLSVLLGQGDGSFASGGSYFVGGGPNAVVAQDFNGDGKADLAVANLLSKDVAVLLGNGDGSFVFAGSVPVGLALFGIASADLDGDGRPDIVVTNGTSGSVPGQSVLVMLGNGDGTFRVAPALATGLNPLAVAIGDVNADGIQDLVVANADAGTVTVMLGAGGGHFRIGTDYAAGSSPQAVVLGDLNGDGRPDIVVANAWSNTVAVLLNRGSGLFAAAVAYPAGNAPSGLVLADFDGDGKLDAAAFTQLGNDVVVLPGTGSGTFDPGVHYGVAASPMAIATADFNGDGRPDIAATGTSGNVVSVLLNSSTSPSPGSLTIVAGTPQAATVGTSFGVAFSVLLRNGSGTPVPAASVTFAAPATGASGLFGAATTAQTLTSSAGVATAPPFLANTVPGSYAVVASTGALSASFTLTNTSVSTVAPLFTSAPPANGQFNTAYTHQAIASGAPTPTYSVTANALPPGLALNGTTGFITGLPTLTGTFAGTLMARNGTLPDASQTFAITVAPAAQTITFGVLADRPAGSSAFVVAATATSGLPVTFSTLTPGVCALSVATVSVLAAGTCTVRASQSGNGNYAAALPVDRTFDVTRASQTIVFTSPGPAHLNAPGTAVSATASSGLAVTISSITPATCVMSGPLLYGGAAGTCTLRATQVGDANFQPAAPVDQSIQVLPAWQSIVFALPDAHALSDIRVPLSAFSASGLPITFSSQTASVCSISGAFAVLVASGTCTVQASQPGDASFAPASPVIRSFQVAPAVTAPTIPAPTAPVVEYITRVGSTGGDRTYSIAVAPDGAAYIAGSLASTNYPGITASAVTNAGQDLVFVSRLAPESGAPVFTSVIGARASTVIATGALSYIGADQVEAFTVDAAGNAYIVAYAYAVDLPLQPGTFGAAGSKRIYKVSSSGSVQQLAGALDAAVQSVRALAIDTAGNLYLTGVGSAGLATSAGAAIPATVATSGGPYLLKLAPTGTTLYSTYLTRKGSRVSIAPGIDQSTWDTASTGYAVAIDATGNAYVAGQALAADFPVSSGAPDTADTQNRDAFVVKVSPTGQALVFVARLGGGDAERATDVAVAPDGSLIVAGKTASIPFVGTTNAFQSSVTFDAGTVRESRETAFVARLAPDGSSWRAVAGIGSSGGNLVKDVGAESYPVRAAVDATGAVYVAGTMFPNRSLPLLQNQAGSDAYGTFVMKISPDLSALRYSTTLGAGMTTGLAIDGFGSAYVSGQDGGLFVAKLNDATVPLTMTADVNPAISGQTVALRAVIADARYGGVVEFSEAGQLLGTVPIASGVATLAVKPAAGVHRFQAAFQGSGPFGRGTLAQAIVTVLAASATP